MKTQWILPSSLILLVLAFLVSCASAAPLAAGDHTSALSTQVPATPAVIAKEPTGTQPAPITPTQVTPENKTVNATPAQTPPGSESSAGVISARQDLARRLGISMDSVKVSAVIGQEFTNEAFYCQVTKERISKVESPASISGFSILLDASGQRYEYHASGQTVVFCRPLS
jgi:hypothetical protein